MDEDEPYTAPAEQGESLEDKLDRLESSVARLLARLDLLILPRIASMNAKADMLLERDDPGEGGEAGQA